LLLVMSNSLKFYSWINMSRWVRFVFMAKISLSFGKFRFEI
jgi:hypothetical protein